ncbi:MAG: hypothetical protein ACTIID_03385 [Brevibacterium linens]|uniref:hypothetical protein n=1 Tax=Brevibacterium linens TaxID=1703 RepID=UPI003F9DB4B3
MESFKVSRDRPLGDAGSFRNCGPRERVGSERFPVGVEADGAGDAAAILAPIGSELEVVDPLIDGF